MNSDADLLNSKANLDGSSSEIGKRPRMEGLDGRNTKRQKTRELKIAWVIDKNMSCTKAQMFWKRLNEVVMDRCLTQVTQYCDGLDYVVVSSQNTEKAAIMKWMDIDELEWGDGNDFQFRIVTMKWAQQIIKDRGVITAANDEENTWMMKVSMTLASQALSKGLSSTSALWSVDNKPWFHRLPVQYQKEFQVWLNQSKELMIKPPTRVVTGNMTASHLQRYDRKRSFMCYKSGTSSIKVYHHNDGLVKEFEKLLEYNKAFETANETNTYRKMSYSSIVHKLKSMPFKVTHVDQVKNYKGFGTKVLEKIKEFLAHGRVMKAEYIANDRKNMAIRELTACHGIANKRAMELYEKGFHSIKDLRERGEQSGVITPSVRIGLKYYEDFQLRMDREEAAEIGRLVREAASVAWPDQEVKSEVCGSFRRGKPTCGDIDILITFPNLVGSFDLWTLIRYLEKKGILTDHLTHSKRAQSSNGLIMEKQTYMGVCKLPSGNHHRRIDIKIYPRHMYPFAILYFTGNDHFNRSIRSFCHNKRLTLSDEGLFKAIRNKRERIGKGDRCVVECKTEKDIFSYLGLPYKDPTQRNCEDMTNIGAGEMENQVRKSFKL